MTDRLDAYVFYFDLVGFTEQYCAQPDETLRRLRRFQWSARHHFNFSRPNTYVVTLFDNVWCRVNAEQPGMPSLLLDFSGLVMTEAEANGFPKYFGAITRGIHEFDPLDRMLVGKEDFEDLTMQHIDITSEPHIRAALVEKWAKNTEFGANSVWVSNEVCRKDDVVAFANMFPDSGYRSFPESMDVLNIHGPTRWPFPQSVFHPIGPKV